jgi:hypothetical protein
MSTPSVLTTMSAQIKYRNDLWVGREMPEERDRLEHGDLKKDEMGDAVGGICVVLKRLRSQRGRECAADIEGRED